MSFAELEVNEVPDREEPLPTFQRLSEINDDPQVEWLAESFLLAKEMAVLGGRGGQMKSTVALAAIAALATGGRVFGQFDSNAAFTTAIVSGEDSAGIIKNRLTALCRGHGFREQLAQQNIHVLALAGVDLAEPKWVRHIVRECLGRGVSLIWLDPLAELASWGENDPDERRRLVWTLRRIATETDATLGLVHHFKKSPGDIEKSDDLLRGGSALANAMRQSYAIEQSVPNDPTSDLAITCLKFSRAAKPAPFVLRPMVTTAERNTAVWKTARLDYVASSVAKLDRAEEFVLQKLDGGNRLTTTDLKREARGTGVSAVEVSRALNVLEMRKVIDFAPGDRGAKLWGHLAETARQPGQGQNDLAGQRPHFAGQGQSETRDLASPPIGGQGRATTSPELRQPDQYEFEERVAFRGGA